MIDRVCAGVAHTRAVELWRSFVAAHGEGVVRAAYVAADVPAPGERVYEFRDNVGQTVAWAGLAPAPFDGSCELRLGVWPAFERQGVRRAVEHHVLGAAFQDPRCGHVTAVVLRTNRGHAERMLREAKPAHSRWRLSAERWLPPPGHLEFMVQRAGWENDWCGRGWRCASAFQASVDH